MYGSEVFGYHEYDSLYKLHLRALRAFFGLPKNVTSAGLLSEVDWLLPKFQSQLKMIHFFGRILRTEENRLLSKKYKWDFQINSSGLVQTWTSEVKDMDEAIWRYCTSTKKVIWRYCTSTKKVIGRYYTSK